MCCCCSTGTKSIEPEVPPESISFRLALDASEEVALSPGPDFEDLLPGLDAVDLEPTDPAPAFTSVVPSAPVPVGGPVIPSLGGAGVGAGAGSGLGSGSGLGGGGATFFGLAAEGADLCTSWTSQAPCRPAGTPPRETSRWDDLRGHSLASGGC